MWLRQQLSARKQGHTATTDVVPDAKPVNWVIGVIWPGRPDIVGRTVATLGDGTADAGKVHLGPDGCLRTLDIGQGTETSTGLEVGGPEERTSAVLVSLAVCCARINGLGSAAAPCLLSCSAAPERKPKAHTSWAERSQQSHRTDSGVHEVMLTLWHTEV